MKPLFLISLTAIFLAWHSECRNLRARNQRKHEAKSKTKTRLLPEEYLTETPVFHSQIPIVYSNNTRHPFEPVSRFNAGPPNFQPSSESQAFSNNFGKNTVPSLATQNANSASKMLNQYNTMQAVSTYSKNDKIINPVYFQPVSLQNRYDPNQKLLNVPEEANIVGRGNNDRLGSSARDYNDYYSKYFQKYYLNLGEDKNNPIKSFDDTGAVFSNPQLKNIYKYIPMIYAQNYNNKLLEVNTSLYEIKKQRRILKDPNGGCPCVSQVSELCDCDETDNSGVLRAPTLVMPILQPIIQQMPEPECNKTCVEEFEDCYCPVQNETECAPPAPPVDECGKPKCKCPCTPKPQPKSRNTLEHRTVVNNINQLEHNSYMFNFDPGTRFKERVNSVKQKQRNFHKKYDEARFQSIDKAEKEVKEKMATAKRIPFPSITVNTFMSDEMIDKMSKDQSNLTMTNMIPKEVLGRVVSQETYENLEKDLAESESFTMVFNGALNETLHGIQKRQQKDILRIGDLPPQKEPATKKLIVVDVKNKSENE